MGSRKATTEQARDTGLAIVLILLIFIHVTKRAVLILPAIVVLVLTMTWPAAFRPVARIWFGLSHILGTVVSKILLTIVFMLVATPVGLVMRIGNKDPMRLKTWKDGAESVFVKRDHLFSAKDLEKPY